MKYDNFKGQKEKRTNKNNLTEGAFGNGEVKKITDNRKGFYQYSKRYRKLKRENIQIEEFC